MKVAPEWRKGELGSGVKPCLRCRQKYKPGLTCNGWFTRRLCGKEELMVVVYNPSTGLYSTYIHIYIYIYIWCIRIIYCMGIIIHICIFDI